jgi:hypothetical protein
VIVCYIACKHCNVWCEKQKAKGEAKVEHDEDCPANYVGSSKGMESEEAIVVTMMRDGYEKNNICMDDEDTTTKASCDTCGQMKSKQEPCVSHNEKGHNDMQDKGKLELCMIAPRVLADLTHRKKIFRSALWYMLKECMTSKPLSKRCTNRDILKL